MLINFNSVKFKRLLLGKRTVFSLLITTNPGKWHQKFQQTLLWLSIRRKSSYQVFQSTGSVPMINTTYIELLA